MIKLNLDEIKPGMRLARSIVSESGELLLSAGNDTPLHLAGMLSLDHWQGRDEVQFRLADLATVPRV